MLKQFQGPQHYLEESDFLQSSNMGPRLHFTAPVAKGMPCTDWLRPGVQEPVTMSIKAITQKLEVRSVLSKFHGCYATRKGEMEAAKSTTRQDLNSIGLERLRTLNPMEV